MSAIIRSILNGDPLSEVIGQSREDLRSGDLVTCNSVDAHITYLWSLDFTPNDADGTPSSATLSSTNTAITSFTPDNEGSYLLRLVVDAGLATEDTQTVRLRALTVFGRLQLVSAGEKNDSTGQIPVDVDTEGWAHEQNQNIQKVLRFTKSVSSSGRVYYVDANRGKDNSNPQNDPTIAEGYADYSSIQDAINAALADTVTPDEDNPFLVRIRPGFYEEDLTVPAFVYLEGLRGNKDYENDRSVLVKPLTAGVSIIVATTNSSEIASISGIFFENTENSNTDGVIEKTGDGTLCLRDCTVLQNADTAAPAISLLGGDLYSEGCVLESLSTLNPTDTCFNQEGSSTRSIFKNCNLSSPSGLRLNPLEVSDVFSIFENCNITSTDPDPSAFGIDSNANTLLLSRCEISSGTNSLDIHASGAAYTGSMIVNIVWSSLSGEISFDTTGITGFTSLNLGSIEYSDLNLTGALTSGPNATIQGTSLFYDNTSSTLVAEDVQSAIDELAAAAGGTVNIQDESAPVGAFGTLNFVGSAVTATPGLPGIVDITVTGGGIVPTQVVRETPTGAIDGINTVYTLAGISILSGSEEVFLNGILQDSSALDYVFVGANTIDFSVSSPPLIGDILRVNYLDAGVASTNTIITREIPAGAIDGVNTVYTLANNPIVLGSERVFLNGVLQDPVAGDYNFVGPNQIDFVPSGPPTPGDILRVTYEIP